MKKLNFGCGSIQPKGWVNVDSDSSFLIEGKDLHPHTHAFADGSMDMIVAHCSLQMVEYHDVHRVLGELYRLLRDGGVLRVSLPDILIGFHSFIRGDISFFPNAEPDISDRFTAWLTWYSTSKTLFTFSSLRNSLERAGFGDVLQVDYMETLLSTMEITELDSREGECFIVETMK